MIWVFVLLSKSILLNYGHLTDKIGMKMQYHDSTIDASSTDLFFYASVEILLAFN